MLARRGPAPRCERRAFKVGRPLLRSHDEHRALPGRLRRLAPAAITGTGLLLLTGCSAAAKRGWEPGTSTTTNQTGKITELWIGSWIAALSVGALVWILVIWCVIAYRRRREDTGMPVQTRYHIPLEILYTVVPIMMVGVLFYFTAKDQAAIADTSKKPDITIGVIGKQWAWDFNYKDAQVYETGVQGQLNGKPGVEATLPTLYLPVGKRVEFDITSNDVIHSFWVPAFLYKMDAIPGLENKFQIIPGEIGDYKGKCSELCGEYHSEMLFNVKVVSQADFDKHMQDLRAKGQTGQLPINDGRAYTIPGGGYKPGNPAASATSQPNQP
jgi:cytochrome c oxidase subunit 2